MDYISVKEAAKAWGITERRVRTLCAEGRIEGAARHGDWAWSIPANTQRPADGRSLRFIKNTSFRAGVQHYDRADFVKGTPSSVIAVADSIVAAMDFDETPVTAAQVNAVLSGSVVPDLDLSSHILIRNIATILNDDAEAINDYSVRQTNSLILRSVDNSKRGVFRAEGQQNLFTTLMLQCRRDWGSLHPIARSAFLLGEMLRIRPFVKANGATAVCAMQAMLRCEGYPMVDFPPENLDELKAALAATGTRGNYQNLVSLLINLLIKAKEN
ncbi:MAG: Fic family protein [Spirochaetales bacterium]|nr:Fic family protein [Spirochaetales bacterium]